MGYVRPPQVETNAQTFGYGGGHYQWKTSQRAKMPPQWKTSSTRKKQQHIMQGTNTTLQWGMFAPHKKRQTRKRSGTMVGTPNGRDPQRAKCPHNGGHPQRAKCPQQWWTSSTLEKTTQNARYEHCATMGYVRPPQEETNAQTFGNGGGHSEWERSTTRENTTQNKTHKHYIIMSMFAPTMVKAQARL